MNLATHFRAILRWLPSLMIAVLFIHNALEKIVHPHQLDKLVTNSAVLRAVGLILLLAVILFLIHKTMMIGATILALYMCVIVFIHMYKGKPYEVALLIVAATIFAVYIRQSTHFRKEKDSITT